MPSFTALLHTHNDALRLGRALETLYPCDEILVVDHSSSDATVPVAREYGAHVIAAAVQGKDESIAATYVQMARYDWILCLDPREALTEGLAASLFDWKLEEHQQAAGATFSIFVREEGTDGWRDLALPQTRLVPRSWNLWQGYLPADNPAASPLEGSLLRFHYP
jgi:glycosyltransferase involved in cell wall biosynthesis